MAFDDEVRRAQDVLRARELRLMDDMLARNAVRPELLEGQWPAFIAQHRIEGDKHTLILARVIDVEEYAIRLDWKVGW